MSSIFRIYTHELLYFSIHSKYLKIYNVNIFINPLSSSINYYLSLDICGLRCQNFKKINEVPIFTQIAKTTPPHTSTHTQLSNHTHIKL